MNTQEAVEAIQSAHCVRHDKQLPACQSCQDAKMAAMKNVGKHPIALVDAPDPLPMRARNTDPETSHEAAAIASDNSASIRNAILDTLEKYGPLTEEECAIQTGIERTSLSPHFKPMIREGRVVNMLNPDGSKMKRPNPTSGVMAMVRGLPKHQVPVVKVEEKKPVEKVTAPVTIPDQEIL